MGVNDREKAKLEQEIADLRRKQARAVEVDKTLDAALSKMRDEVRGYDSKYDEQVKRKKEALEKKKFSSTWDPKLTEALEIVRKPLQSYGENCEKAVAKLLKAVEKGLESGASEYKASRCVDAALGVLSDAENCTISFYQISKTLKYQPTYEGRSTKKSLEKIKKDLSSGAGTIESQIKTREEKIRRIEKADKYGVALDKLDTHESYLTAVKNYEKATTGDQLRLSAKELKALGSYLNSKTLFEECDKKVKAIEEVEKAEKAVSDAKKALADAEKELKAAESDKSGSETELKNSEAELQKIEAGVDGEKASVAGEYNRNCNQNDELVEKQNAELDSLITQKTEAEFALSKTFFLAFGKKKELNARIASLSASIEEKKDEIENTKKKKDDYLRTQNSKLKDIDDKVTAARKKAKDASSKLDVATQRLEKAKNSLETAKSNLEKANQNYDSVISKKKEKEAALEAEILARKEKEKAEEEARKQAKIEAERKAAEEERKRTELEAQRRSASSSVYDDVDEDDVASSDYKFKLPVEDVFTITGRGTVITGRVATGTVKVNDKVKIIHSDGSYIETVVTGIEAFRKLLDSAKEGDNVGLLCSGISRNQVSRGDIIAICENSSNVLYSPGNEPDAIKRRLDTLFEKLDGAYPDKVVVGLHNDHKKWGETVTELYRKLGYESGAAFLKAYGYTVAAKTGKAGRPASVAPEDIIAFLQDKYAEGPIFEGLNELIADNPELAGNLKTINNKSNELFGTTLKAYLVQQGILLDASIRREKEREEAIRQRELAKQSKLDAKQAEIDRIAAEKKEQDDFVSAITEEFMSNCGIEFMDAAFVITDPEEEMDYYRIVKAIEDRGGFHRSAVSGKTRFLIAPRKCDTVKYQKAVELQSQGSNIRILNEKQFFEAVEKYDAYVASTDILDRATFGGDIGDGSSAPASAGLVVEGDRVVAYSGSDKRIAIPDGVRVIGKNAFAGSSVESISMPDTVINIEQNAFSGCKMLSNVKWSANLQTIGDGAFEFCKRITSIILPKANVIGSIGQRAFAHCYSLKKVEMAVTSIGASSFEKCLQLETVTILSKLSGIEANTFRDCIVLKNFEIEQMPANVHDDAFANCVAYGVSDTVEESVTEEMPVTSTSSSDVADYATQLAREVSEPVTSIVFAGKVFVHTTCTNESKIDKLVAQKGGEVKSSTVLKTDYIIIGDKIDHETTKITKAIELNGQGKNIKAMTESEFWALANGDVVSKPVETVEDVVMQKTETHLKIAVRNNVLWDIVSSNRNYGMVDGIEICDNDTYFMIIVGEGVHEVVPKTITEAHRGIIRYLSQVVSDKSTLDRNDKKIIDNYDFIQWCDEEIKADDDEEEAKSTILNCFNGLAGYSEGDEDTVWTYYGNTQAELGIYVKSADLWNKLAGLDFSKYGIKVDISSLSKSGKTLYVTSYKNGWNVLAEKLDEFAKELSAILAKNGNKSIFFVIQQPEFGGIKYTFDFGEGLRDVSFGGEDMDKVLDIDEFLEEHANLSDMNATIKELSSGFMEPTFTEEEWDNMKAFGIDVDAIQEELMSDTREMLDSMKDMLESMKSLFGGLDDDEDTEEE